jgi:two-component system KDP operon response regulator KdpE
VTDVLVVEDQPALRRVLRLSLESQGISVREAESGTRALQAVNDRTPDAIVLDLGLPDIDGMHVLRRLRASTSVPVIVLTVRDRASDKITALDAGADDYVTKPFDVRELLARLRAALRRAPASGERRVLRLSDPPLEIDFARHRVRRGGEDVHLTRTELRLLEELATRPGQLLTHATLLQRVWGEGYGKESHYVRVYVGQLRKKLHDDAASPKLIATEPGIGYRWIAAADV